MSAEEITDILSQHLKLVRREFGLSQERMAAVLGLSKKTLIQVEKNRISLSQPAAVALCALFSHSETLRWALGDDPLTAVKAALLPGDLPRTAAEKIWWRREDNCLQQ